MAITILKYPENIEEDSFSTRRMVFMAIPGEIIKDVDKKWYRGQKGADVVNDQRANELDVRCMITLPIPGSIRDSQSHEWQQESVLNNFIEIGAALGGNFLEGLSQKLSEKSGGLIPDKDDIKTIISKGNSLAAHLLGARKRVPCPGEYQSYNTSSLRSFSFSFDFIPENKNESKHIIDIITAFKTFSSPSTDMSVVTMLSPFMWLISITNGAINKMLNLKVCVCTNVDVTYGTDKFDIFEDGMPKKISLSLNFSESELTYAQNYNTGLETQANASTTVLSASSGYSNSFNVATDENIMNNKGGGLVDRGIKHFGDIKDSLLEQMDVYKDELADQFYSWFGSGSSSTPEEKKEETEEAPIDLYSPENQDTYINPNYTYKAGQTVETSANNLTYFDRGTGISHPLHVVEDDNGVHYYYDYEKKTYAPLDTDIGNTVYDQSQQMNELHPRPSDRQIGALSKPFIR